jgi:hypothetical protein
MKQVEPMHWLWHRAPEAQRSWVVARSSRRIPCYGAGQAGKKDQSSLLA